MLQNAFLCAENTVNEDPELISLENTIAKKYVEKIFVIKSGMVN